MNVKYEGLVVESSTLPPASRSRLELAKDAAQIAPVRPPRGMRFGSPQPLLAAMGRDEVSKRAEQPEENEMPFKRAADAAAADSTEYLDTDPCPPQIADALASALDIDPPTTIADAVAAIEANAPEQSDPAEDLKNPAQAVNRLTARELALCKDRGWKPETFARTKARVKLQDQMWSKGRR